MAKKQKQRSYAIIKQKLTLNSIQAQRVVQRSLKHISQALFSLDVILRVVGDAEDIDQVENIIQELIDKVVHDMSLTRAQVTQQLKENGITDAIEYSAPQEYVVEITTPQTSQFVHLIRELDTLTGQVEALWLSGAFTSKQREQATFHWQQRLIKLAGRIIGIQKRAKSAAYKKGKQQEVDSQIGEKVPGEVTDSELKTIEDELTVEELSEGEELIEDNGDAA